MRKSIVTVLEPTDPNYDLVTVDEVNEFLDITGNTADDAKMAVRITRISKMIGDLCDRTFAMLTVSESFRPNYFHQFSSDQATLYLTQYPIDLSQSLTVTIGLGQPLDTTNYEVDDEAGLLWAISPFWNVGFFQWFGPTIVQYTGGYDLPDGAPTLLKQACLETIKVQIADTKRDPNVRSTTHGDTSVMFNDPFLRLTRSAGTIAALPPNANEMIQPFMRLSV